MVQESEALGLAWKSLSGTMKIGRLKSMIRLRALVTENPHMDMSTSFLIIIPTMPDQLPFLN